MKDRGDAMVEMLVQLAELRFSLRSFDWASLRKGGDEALYATHTHTHTHTLVHNPLY
jgi:hypothetical protein